MRNKVEKFGMAFVIKEILNKFNVKAVYLDGYENDKDRVCFQFDNHECRFAELHGINLEEGTIDMVVIARGVELEDWERLRLNMLIHHFRYETLLKIAIEVYAHLGVVSEVDEFITEKYANYIDTFGE